MNIIIGKNKDFTKDLSLFIVKKILFKKIKLIEFDIQ